ncbi:uncharacterized protein C8orf59 homolog [Pseudomyrmex gracilis]|uniref:uncharacterized protein C8orf59 homolog n=1 Tax=Pseudomyrmex gracilis TaxID=219809 RepID=UPI000994EE39|nr:uncharacterized protein C8orf59 homolog [Pseudomyrmex gracilis]
MGKNKGNHKNKNVFKVAKVRSMKCKNKAQKVITNLKKLDLKKSKILNKDKTANMDQLLEELRRDVKTTNVKQTGGNSKKQSDKTNRQPWVNRVSPQQTEATTSLMERMQLDETRKREKEK